MEFRERLEGVYSAGEQKILTHPAMEALAVGQLTIPKMRGYATQWYHVVRAFPGYLRELHDRTEDRQLRAWLRANMRVERAHTKGWEDLERAVGIDDHTIHHFTPLPEVEEWHQYLLHVNSNGEVPVPAAVSATNIGVEGITGSLTRKLYRGFQSYDGKDGIHIDDKAIWWLDQHAEYDDMHPKEARELAMRLATTPELQERCLDELATSLKRFYEAIRSINEHH